MRCNKKKAIIVYWIIAVYDLYLRFSEHCWKRSVFKL